MKNLGERSLTAVFWGSGGAVFKIVLQFGALVVLARILGPEQYGLFAIGATVVSFSGFFSDFGIAYGLIQKQEVTKDDLRFVTTWQLLIGTIVTVAVFLASTPIASFFGDMRAAPVIATLAAVCILNALAAPSLNLLKRSLDFKSIQIAQIAAYFIGFIAIGIPLALLGFQVWAIVAAWLVQALVTLAMLFARTRHAVQPLLWFKGASDLIRYGLTVLTTNLVNWIIGNIDRVVIARMFSSRDIGLYSNAYNMLYNPTASMLGVLQPVFFSASMRISDDPKRIVEAYLALVGFIAVFLLPLFAGLSAVADTFVLVLYGEAWREAGAVLRPIALAMPLFLVWGMTTPLVWAGGKPGREWKIQLPLAVLWILTTWWAAHYSPAAVGWSVAMLAFVRFLAMLTMAMRMLNMQGFRIWQTARNGLLLAAACAAGMSGADHLLISSSSAVPAVRLVADILVGGSIMLGAAAVFPRLLPVETASAVRKIATKAPAPIAAAAKILLLRGYP